MKMNMRRRTDGICVDGICGMERTNREIVPVPQYTQSLPLILLNLMKHAFSLEIGTCLSYR